MATAEKVQPQVNQQQMMDFAFKVVGDLAAAMSGPLIYIGDKLGLFKVLAASGPLTVGELAERTNLNERYLREWSSAMVAAEYLQYDPATQRVALSPEHSMVLANDDSPVFVGGLAQMIPDHYRIIPRTIQCMQEGGGIPYSEFSEDTFVGTERLFRPGYLNFLTSQWIPAMPDVHARLQKGARVADVGCGRGQALLAMARAYPKSEFVGFDNYQPGIDYGNGLAQRNQLSNLSFRMSSANTLPQSPKFDLIMTCDSLHDMVSPEAAARSIFGALKDDGVWFCIEPNVRDRLEENVNPLGRLFYSVSMLQCMSCSLAQNGAGYGAGMGEANIRRVAQLAGFNQFTRLPVDNPFNQFFDIRK
jgi:ubiquinone/menaquinone biosynthesis C-methylase UbiE